MFELPNELLKSQYDKANLGLSQELFKPNFGPIDHVAENIKLSSKINHIRDI